MDNQEFAQAVRKTIMKAYQAAGCQPVHVFLTPDSLRRLQSLKENQLANIREPDPISLMGWPFSIREDLQEPVVVAVQDDLQPGGVKSGCQQCGRDRSLVAGLCDNCTLGQSGGLFPWLNKRSD